MSGTIRKTIYWLISAEPELHISSVTDGPSAGLIGQFKQGTAVTIGYPHSFGWRMRVGAQRPHYRLLASWTSLWFTLPRGTPSLAGIQFKTGNFSDYCVSAHANFKSNLASRKPARAENSSAVRSFLPSTQGCLITYSWIRKVLSAVIYHFLLALLVRHFGIVTDREQAILYR